ncbi:MAG: hypothetical protein U5N21_11340 [Rhodococcus sp. (in: high G+C Gram-positive bacteria)]|nr:hypothetical protein [Rhodococcus sp. (in: high G+C Gram-positive bacteria)]
MNSIVQQRPSITTEIVPFADELGSPRTEFGRITAPGHRACSRHDRRSGSGCAVLHCRSIFALGSESRGLQQQRAQAVRHCSETRLRGHRGVTAFPAHPRQPNRDRMERALHRPRDALGNDITVGGDHLTPAPMHVDLVHHEHDRRGFEGCSPLLDVDAAHRSRRVDDDHHDGRVGHRVREVNRGAAEPGQLAAQFGLARPCSTGEVNPGRSTDPRPFDVVEGTRIPAS